MMRLSVRVLACGICLLLFASDAAWAASRIAAAVQPAALAAYGAAWMHVRRARALEASDASASDAHWKTAADLLQSALILDPQEPLVGRPLAAILLRLGRIDEAAGLLRRFPIGRFDPADDGLSMILAAPHTPGVLEAYSRAIAAEPAGSPQRRVLLREVSDYCALKGRQGEAADHLLTLVEGGGGDAPGVARMLLLASWSANLPRILAAAEAFLSRAESLDDADSVLAVESLGRLYVAAERLQDGLQFLQTLQMRHPQNARVCLQRLGLLRQAGDATAVAAAGKDFLATTESADVRTALALILAGMNCAAEAADVLTPLLDSAALDAGAEATRASAGALLIADTLRHGGELERAADLVDRVLRGKVAGDLRKAAIVERAQLHVRLEAYDKARELLDAARADAPSDGALCGAAAEARFLAGDRAAAFKLLEDFLASAPARADLLEARRALAGLLERGGDFDGAVAILRRNLADDPRDAVSANNLGYLFATRAIHLDEALALVQTALQIAPAEPAYLDSLAWVKYKLALRDDQADVLQQAVRVMAEALRLSQGDPVMLDHQGDMLYTLGQWAAARAEWLRALELAERVRDKDFDRASVREKLRSIDESIRRRGDTPGMPRPLAGPPRAAAE